MFHSIIMTNGAVMRAGAPASWKQRRERGISSASVFSSWLVVLSHLPTLKYEVKRRLINGKRTFVCFLRQWKQPFMVCVLVLEPEGTPLNIQRLSHLLKWPFSATFAKALNMSRSHQCFQPAVTSATSSSSHDCTIHHNSAVEHCIRS